MEYGIFRIMRMQHQQIVADTLNHGGSSITASSFIIFLANTTMGFLDAHYFGILALCAIGGFILSFLGWRMTHANKKIVQEIKLAELRKLHREEKAAKKG